MEAIILAGGCGSRLRPITAQKPKPLCTLLGKPVIRHILDLLAENGIDRATITAGYQGDRLRAGLLGETPLPLRFFSEDTPLGTAGGVRRAMEGCTEDFIVISGDAMCDFDLTAALRFHKRSGSVATILGHRVADPREYGLICADEQGTITSFAEKPSYLGCVSDLANTGVYILSPKALDEIPAEGASDFARTVFPSMLQKGLPLRVFEPDGYWCDVGDVKSYLRCQADMLAGRVRFRLNAHAVNGNLLAQEAPAGSYILHSPCYIGREVTIGEGSVIGPNTVLEDGARLGRNCRITGSVIGKGAVLGNGVRLTNAVAGEFSELGSNATAGAGCVIGTRAIVGREAQLSSGARLWPELRLRPGAQLLEDMEAENSFGGSGFFFADEGLTGIDGLPLTPEICLRAGSGAASLSSVRSIGFGRGPTLTARTLSLAAMAGATASGGNVWDFGECSPMQFLYCLRESHAGCGIYFDGGQQPTARFFGKDGLPLSREEERLIEGAVNRREYRRAGSGGMGRLTDLSNMPRFYRFELLKHCDTTLTGLRVRVRSVSAQPADLLEEALRRLGCETGEGGLTVCLSPDGESAALTQGGVRMSSERFLAAVCLTEFAAGHDVALAQTAPRAIDSLAKEYGRRVLRYCDCPCGDRDKEARQLAARQPQLRDALMGVIRLLSYMVREGLRLDELCRRIPAFTVHSRLLSIAVSPGELLRRLSQKGSGLPEGILLQKSGACGLVRPLKSGRGVLLFSESTGSETAVETGDLFERIVREATVAGDAAIDS